MNDSDPPTPLAPDRWVARRIAEVFAGQTCAVCGDPAVRLTGDQFYCTRHHPPAKMNTGPPQVYRHPDFR